MTDTSQVELAIAAAVDRGDFAQAIALIDEVLEGSPNPRRAHYLYLSRARLQMITDDAHAALSDLTAALELATSDTERAAALIARAELAAALGDVEQARADCDAILTTLDAAPTNAHARHILGGIERDHGSAERAVDLLRAAREQMIAENAELDAVAEVTLDLAMALRAVGDTRGAIAMLEDALPHVDPEMAARISIQLGTTYGFEGNYEAALLAWEHALSLLSDPADRARVHYNRGVVYRDLADFDSARRELDQALADNVDADPNIAFDTLLLLGVIEREAGDVHESLAHLVQAATVKPDGDAHGRARLEIGSTMATAGMFGMAVEGFSAAVDLCEDPHDRARAHRFRGMAQQEMGQLDAALADFAAAIELTADPEERSRDALTLSSLLQGAGRHHAAIKALDIAVASTQDPAIIRQLLAHRGTLHSEAGNLEAAISDLEQAEVLSMTADNDLHARALADLGAIYVAVGREADALAAFEQAASLAGSGPVATIALCNLGDLMASRGEPLPALHAFERAAAAAEDDRDARARAFLARAHAGLRFRRYREADADYARVLMLQPSDDLRDSASIGHHTTQQHLENLEKMRNELTRVIQAHDEPSFRAGPTLQRGLIALQLGDIDRAIIDITRATRLAGLNPEKALAHAHLALVYAHDGQCAAAVEELRDAEALDPARAWLTALQGDVDWRACRGFAGFVKELLG